ncbi:LysR family transcriptional regulator [Burkholderia thailandensis]|nr:LysR family transcriptional regulator [Burkholderia thailandensis]
MCGSRPSAAREQFDHRLRDVGETRPLTDDTRAHDQHARARLRGVAQASLHFRADRTLAGQRVLRRILAQLALIRCGAGIGVCQTAFAKRDPALARVLPKAFAGRLDMWVTMHEDPRGSPRCRAAFEALAEGLGAYVDERRAPAIARLRRPRRGTRSA